jgi:hypothetical protein
MSDVCGQSVNDCAKVAELHTMTPLSSAMRESSRCSRLRPLLHRRTLRRSEAAKDAAVAGQRSKQRAASVALVEEQARVGRHMQPTRVPALRTGQRRSRLQNAHRVPRRVPCSRRLLRRARPGTRVTPIKPFRFDRIDRRLTIAEARLRRNERRLSEFDEEGTWNEGGSWGSDRPRTRACRAAGPSCGARPP